MRRRRLRLLAAVGIGLAVALPTAVFNVHGVVASGCSGAKNRTSGTCYAGAGAIKNAAAAANPGDRIDVSSGTYNGGVTVTKANVQLVARDDAHAKVVSPGQSGPTHAFTVEANGVEIRGFEVYGFVGTSEACGIFVGGSDFVDHAHHANGAVIEGNNVHDNGRNICLWQSNDNLVRHNRIANSHDVNGSNGDGLLSYNGTGDAEITAANTSGHSGTNNRIIENWVTGNARSGMFIGACPPVGCFSGGTVHDNISGTVIKDNHLSGNGFHPGAGNNETGGVSIYDASGGTVIDNDANGNDIFGISVDLADGVTVKDNTADNNVNHGFEDLFNTSGNSFRDNEAFNNGNVDMYGDGVGADTFGDNDCGTATPSKAAWQCG